MAMIPGFEYDLFVSYAHADNVIAEEEEGWITQFVSRLRAALGMRLGTSSELKIFCDSNEIRANSRLPELLLATRKSALFLAIGSPSYVASDWTRRELATFVEQNPDLSRLFMIEFLPLNSDERYPSPLHENIRLRFWKSSGPRNLEMSLSPHADRDLFSSLIHTLAADIGKELIKRRVLHPLKAQSWIGEKTHEAVIIGGSDTQLARPKKTVLLAQTTEDLDDELDQLRSFLLQHGDEVTVLPSSGYPQGGDAFKSAFRSDLAQAELFVQLLGKRAGRMPPDLPEGYTHFQSESAKSSTATILQWRHPDLDPESVLDSDYKSMLQAETVIASGLESFKLQILKDLRKGKVSVRPARSSTVFINVDDKDLEIAKEVERECLQNALTTILPMSGPSSEAVRNDLAENLIDCDILIFIYGDTTQDWIRGQLRFFNKVRPKRESPPKLLAICSGPPPKADIGIHFPDAHMIDCPSGWNLEPIKKLFSEFAG
jgi:hypothetical protein